MTVAAAAAPSSGAKFAAFLEAVPDAIIGVDSEGAILLMNSQAESLFGYARAELIGQPVELLVPTSVRGAHVRHRATYVRDPLTRPLGAGMELSGRRKDGSEFPAEISLASIELDGQRVVSAAVRDVTERKRSEARLRGLLEAAPDAIVGVAPDGRIALVNTQAEALFAYAHDPLIGQPAHVIVPGAPVDLLRDPYTAPMDTWIALTARREDGSEFPAEISLSAVETAAGLMVCAAIRDVTDRVEAERERDRLEARHERSRLERQLHQTHRLESLGQLAGGVAHDFNNLLAAILNYVSFVSEEITKEIAARPVGERARLDAVLRDVSQIGAAAERAARLTRQLLAFGRREVRKPEILDINATVSEVEALLLRTIGEHVELITRCDPELTPVLADRGQMEQVLLNLAVNARDAILSGGMLTVQTENFDVDEKYALHHPGLQPGPHVRLRVIDTGDGMDRDTVDRAFDPFFSTKAKEKGSGLGLATVYGIVTQTGGIVDLQSEVGVGTTVTILLPSVSSAVTQAEPSRPIKRRDGGETILVVEDEDLVLDVATRILSRNGYRVLAARSGAEALNVIDRHDGPIHLLLTDVVMPGSTGNEVAERVTRLHPDIRVLYMSGYPQSVITSQGVIQPGIRLVSKPFVAADLLDHVRAVLDS